MTRTRLAISAALAIVVVGLLLWQIQRERLVAACLANGQIWNGAQSRCEPPRGPIIERDGLRRS